MKTENQEMILVIDFGGQYNQLIARRVRESGVYCEIVSYKQSLDKIKAKNPKGIIFTGGPNSAYLEDSPTISAEIYELGVPVLGICYGSQQRRSANTAKRWLILIRKACCLRASPSRMCAG